MANYTVFSASSQKYTLKTPTDYIAPPMWKIENEFAFQGFLVITFVAALLCVFCIFVKLDSLIQIPIFCFLCIIDIVFLFHIDQKRKKN